MASFVLDTHLGRLAAYLRLAGFDTLYRNDFQDAELAKISGDEHRILLTRDRELLKRKAIWRGHEVTTTVPRRQLVEVLQTFDLWNDLQPFRRCVHCNALLDPVAKAAVLDLLPPRTRLYYEEFYRCPTCTRVYWKGSHYRAMVRFLEDVKRARTNDSPERRGV